MSFIKKIIVSNTGSAGLLALLGMLFFGMIGGAYITLSSGSLRTSAALRDGVAAQYLAEAGAQWALAQLRINSHYEVIDFKNQITLTEGNYSVTIQNDSMGKIIISKGTVNKTMRTLVLKTSNGVFDKAIYAKGEVTINGGFSSGKNKITGSIESDGKIIINSGNADTLSQKSIVYCTELEDYSGKIKNDHEVQPPTNGKLDINKIMEKKPLFTKNGVNDIDLEAISRKGNSITYLLGTHYYYAGTYRMNEHDPTYKVPLGQKETTIYVDGDFEVSKNIIADDITIYVNGNLTFVNGASIETTDRNARLNIYSTGNIEWNSSNYQGKGLLVAKGNINFNTAASAENTILISDGNIQINQNSKVGGLYASNKVNIADGATVNYNNVKDLMRELKLATPIVNSWSDKVS